MSSLQVSLISKNLWGKIINILLFICGYSQSVYVHLTILEKCFKCHAIYCKKSEWNRSRTAFSVHYMSAIVDAIHAI